MRLSASRFVFVVLHLAFAAALWLGPAPAGASPKADASAPPVAYGLPVAGPIVDPYRPPADPYGPGNRGVDLATNPGDPVGAPADGVVVFAGQVGGDLFVVTLHADGVRTTLGFLATISVRVGQQVHAGQRMGTASTSIHFGARRDGAYIDPLSLLPRGVPHVWLIPTR